MGAIRDYEQLPWTEAEARTHFRALKVTDDLISKHRGERIGPFFFSDATKQVIFMSANTNVAAKTGDWILQDSEGHLFVVPHQALERHYDILEP